MSTYAELRAQAEDLMRQAEEMRKAERAAVIIAVKTQIAEFNLTAGDLGLGVKEKTNKKATGPRGAAPIKYRGPAGETWSGRGRKPVWLEQLIAAGRTAEEFAV